MSAAGVAREPVTRIDAHQVSHRHPQFLPDGRHFLFFASGTPEVRGVYLGSLESQDMRRVVEADAAGTFVPPNYVMFGRQETLFAQRLDLQRLEPLGELFPVAAPVVVDRNSFRPAVWSSLTAVLAYRAAPTQSRQLTWFDRAGKQLGTAGRLDASGTGSFQLSPDGRYAAVTRLVGGNIDIWLVELERQVLRPFSFDAANNSTQVWSPDGSRLVFHSNRTGRYDLYLKPIAGDAPESLLVEFADSENKNANDWSSDGRWVLYDSISPKSTDLWVVPVTGDRKPIVVAQTPFNEGNGRFSPDSRWIAYESDETGRNEIYVQRFPNSGGKWQASTGAGTNAQWRADGREIFYTAAGNRLMAVTVTLPADGAKVQPSTPVALFTLPASSPYAVTPNGQRFLVNVPTDDATVPPVTIVLNWRPAGAAK